MATWRRQREHGALAVLTPQKRGRPGQPASPPARRVAGLEPDRCRPERRLKHAQAIIDAQNTLAEIVGSLLVGDQCRREHVQSAVAELAAHVGWPPACRALGVSRATVYRQPPPARPAGGCRQLGAGPEGRGARRGGCALAQSSLC